MDKENSNIIQDLHRLSNHAINLPLDKLKNSTICFIDNYYAIDDFLDRDSFIFQTALLNTPENKIALILNNFDKAINTHCNNIIDLSHLKLTDDFEYSFNFNAKEKTNIKRYKIYDTKPTDLELFKEYWLLHFISNCRQLVWNIRNILGKPQPEFHKPQNILKLLDETSKKEAAIKEQSIVLFSSSKVKTEKLKDYYTTILPESIEITDNLFFWLEKMQKSFADIHGYLIFEKENLNKIVANYKLNYLDRFETTLKKIQIEDMSTFLSAYQKAIKNLKIKKEIQGDTISIFTELIETKINNILEHPFSNVAVENPLNKTTTKTEGNTRKQNQDFKTVITSESKREYIYNILEHFGAINSERKSMLTQRKKGVLRGVVEALMDNNILPEFGLNNLCFIIAKDINLELNSKLDYHDTAKKVHKEAKRYIKDNPLR